MKQHYFTGANDPTFLENYAKRKAQEESGSMREKVVDFVQEQPNPTDEMMHDWAEAHGYEPHEVEEIIYQLVTDHVQEHMEEVGEAIAGGLASEKGTTEEDVDPEQLQMGIEVEKEHTDDPEIAKEITLDHLTEDPEYYTKLKKIEAQLEESSEEFELVPERDYCGGGLKGYFKVSPSDIVALFGPPPLIGSPDNKTQGEYIFEDQQGNCFSLYDYKEGTKGFWDLTELQYVHIGCRDEGASAFVEWLENKVPSGIFESAKRLAQKIEMSMSGKWSIVDSEGNEIAGPFATQEDAAAALAELVQDEVSHTAQKGEQGINIDSLIEGVATGAYQYGLEMEVKSQTATNVVLETWDKQRPGERDVVQIETVGWFQNKPLVKITYSNGVTRIAEATPSVIVALLYAD